MMLQCHVYMYADTKCSINIKFIYIYMPVSYFMPIYIYLLYFYLFCFVTEPTSQRISHECT